MDGGRRSIYERTFSNKGPQIKIGHDHKLANYLGEVRKDEFRSPEAALGEIAVKGVEFNTKISPRTLYHYIDMGVIPCNSNMDLPHKRNKKEKTEQPRAARSARVRA